MTVAVGGTFNILHDGHRALLDTAMSYGEPVEIGITTDPFAVRTREMVFGYDMRAERVLAYCKNAHPELDVAAHPLDSEDGGIGDREDITVLVVSEETYPRAVRMNESFRYPKAIHCVPLVLDEYGKKVSASEIAGYRKIDYSRGFCL